MRNVGKINKSIWKHLWKYFYCASFSFKKVLKGHILETMHPRMPLYSKNNHEFSSLMKTKFIRYLVLFQSSSYYYMPFLFENTGNSEDLDPARLRVEFLVPHWVPKTTSLPVFLLWEECPHPLAIPPATLLLPRTSIKHRLLPSSLERGQCICQELKSFGASSRTFWYTKRWLEMWLSIKWDVNFHEYFPHGCSLWSLSNLAITMWSVGYTAWVKFKKLAASQWGEGQSSNLCVFLHSFLFLFFLLHASGDGRFFIKSLGATTCLKSVCTSHLVFFHIPSHFI